MRSLTLVCVNLLGLALPALAADRVSTSTVEYAVPDIQLVRDDGTQVSLPAEDEHDDGRAVVLNFIILQPAARSVRSVARPSRSFSASWVLSAGAFI